MVYDGLGGEAVRADIGIRGDTIAFIGDLSKGSGKKEVDAQGMAVAPGFINMLSWATESLIADGRAQSDIRQGVTLEVFGEGWSMGPLTARIRERELQSQSDIKYDITWNTLGGYLETTELPRDGWDHEFIYELYPESGKQFVIRSAGPDGEEGTEDDLLSTDAS